MTSKHVYLQVVGDGSSLRAGLLRNACTPVQAARIPNKVCQQQLLHSNLLMVDCWHHAECTTPCYLCLGAVVTVWYACCLFAWLGCCCSVFMQGASPEHALVGGHCQHTAGDDKPAGAHVEHRTAIRHFN